MARWVTAGVTHAAMESTGVLWKPVWHVHVQDAEWLAQLLQCGLLRASFVPPSEIRELRDLTP
ncbi:MAG TPA: hypothetical protein VMM93_13550 [Vicinamibacterales bacterium]|nr:hypothetical protein [Vicinamibacterales bacterium]